MPNIVPIVRAIESINTPDNRPLPDMIAMLGRPAPTSITELLLRLEGIDMPLRLDVGRPHGRAYAAILAQLGQHSQFVYLDVDEAAKPWEIANVSVADIVRVRELKSYPWGDIDVFLQPSSVRHVLKRESPRFAESYALLVAALADNEYVAVTESERLGEISHVFRSDKRISPFSARCTIEPPPAVMKTTNEIIHLVTKHSVDEAQQLFLAMHDLACDPNAIDALCTPFAYPHSGCETRAHQMCERLLVDHSAVAAKIYLYASGTTESGFLSPKTPNDPACVVNWVYHVAPLVRIRTSAGGDWRVVDPALFRKDEAVPTIDQWRGRQRDANARFVITESALYDRRPDGVIQRDHWDPRFCYAPEVLAKYRAALIQQIETAKGPPPYC